MARFISLTDIRGRTYTLNIDTIAYFQADAEGRSIVSLQGGASMKKLTVSMSPGELSVALRENSWGISNE
jgi:hypothetical protein